MYMYVTSLIRWDKRCRSGLSGCVSQIAAICPTLRMHIAVARVSYLLTLGACCEIHESKRKATSERAAFQHG